MMKTLVIMLAALVGLSHQVPVEVVVGTKVVEVTKVVDVPTTTAEPEVEMNPFGECPPEDVLLPTYLSDTKNCSVFYQCAHGVPYRMECRLPLEFNPNLNVCDYPYQSGCLLKLVVTETEDEENESKNDNDEQEVLETATKVVVLPGETEVNVVAPVVQQVEVMDSVVENKNRNNH